jgi:hypothetical protein
VSLIESHPEVGFFIAICRRGKALCLKSLAIAFFASLRFSIKVEINRALAFFGHWIPKMVLKALNVFIDQNRAT